MGLSKKNRFSAKQNRIADIAKAMAHPARVSILEFLSGQRECVCGGIVNKLPLSQSTVSQHLAELKHAGLVQGEIDGPKVCYCINKKALRLARRELMRFLTHIK